MGCAWWKKCGARGVYRGMGGRAMERKKIEAKTRV
jgi:hypothetical protein